MHNRSMLHANRLFVNLSPDQLDRALTFFPELVSFGPYDQIVREREADNALFLLEQGQAIVRVAGREVGGLVAGDIFGEVGFIASGRRSASVFAAREGCTVRIVRRVRFQELGREHPDAAWVMSENINALLAGKLQRTNQTLRETLERVEQLDAAQQEQPGEEPGQERPSLLRRLLGGIGT